MQRITWEETRWSSKEEFDNNSIFNKYGRPKCELCSGNCYSGESYETSEVRCALCREFNGTEYCALDIGTY